MLLWAKGTDANSEPRYHGSHSAMRHYYITTLLCNNALWFDVSSSRE